MFLTDRSFHLHVQFPGILLVLQHSGREDRQTFKCKHEIVEGILVLFICLGVVLLLVLVDCDLHELDCTLGRNIVPSALAGGQ